MRYGGTFSIRSGKSMNWYLLMLVVVLLTGSGLLWLLNSRFGYVVTRMLMFCWGLGLGIVGIASLWAAIQCLRLNASLLADAFFPLVEVVIFTAIGLGALYGAYRLLMVVMRDWDD